MIRKRLIAMGKIVLLVLIAVALQTLLISRVSILGVTVDLFLVFTVVVALSRGSMDGAIFGFVAGVVADVAFMQPLGVRALVYVLAGYFVGMLVSRFGSVNPWGVFLISGGASLVAQLLFGLFQFMMGPRAGFLTMFVTQILPEAVLDALVAVPVYVLLVRLRILPASGAESRGMRSATE